LQLKIELVYFEGCPGFQPALSLLTQVLEEEGVEATVETIHVESEEMAKRYRFLGSPSIRMNGNDMELEARRATHFGMKCRIYDNNSVPGGIPAKSKIREAIHRREICISILSPHPSLLPRGEKGFSSSPPLEERIEVRRN